MIRKRCLGVSLCGAAVISAGLFVGCHGASHPDDRAAVYKALKQNDLYSVELHQDQNSGVITLTGIVGNSNAKSKAETLAKQAAPGYSISNQLKVDATGIMSMANPNAKPPEVEQSAHPQAH